VTALPVGTRVAAGGPFDPVCGTVTESPAVDPDGSVWECHVEVTWDDGIFEVLPSAVLRPLEGGEE
jgi:hypothetical protein